MTIAEVKSYLLAEFPPEIAIWLDFSAGSDQDGFLTAAAQALLDYGFTPAENVVADALPVTATLVGIAAWEGALGLAGSKVALYGPTETRRAQVIARLRLSGASTIPNITAALTALTGPTPGALMILEHSRAALTTANTHAIIAGSTLLPNTADATITFTLHDNAPASGYGLSLALKLTVNDLSLIQYRLTGPDARTKSWTAQGTGSAVAGDVWLWGKEFAGAQIDGLWTLVISNNDAVDGHLVTPSTVFVEGIGRAAPLSTTEGLGSNIFEWTALINEALVNPATYDRGVAQSIVRDVNPAHARGYLTIYNSNGGIPGVWGDPTDSVWNGFIWA